MLVRKSYQSNQADGQIANETSEMPAVQLTAANRPRQSRRETSHTASSAPGVILVSQPTADQPPRPVAARTTEAVMMPVTCAGISSGTVNSMIGAVHTQPSGRSSQTKAMASRAMQIPAKTPNGSSASGRTTCAKACE